MVRNRDGLKKGLAETGEIISGFDDIRLDSKSMVEAYNMSIISQKILSAALSREESVGAHYRQD